MSLKNTIFTISIFACSLSLVKAIDFPDEWPEEKGPEKNQFTIKIPTNYKSQQISYARLFVLKHKNFFSPRHK